LLALAVLSALQTDVYGLTPPSSGGDGSIRLLNCTVSSQGVLEAVVESQTDDTMTCNIRCNYELGERTFSHTFSVTIRGRFQGHVGRFDTSTGKAGDYSGDLGTCKKGSDAGDMSQ